MYSTHNWQNTEHETQLALVAGVGDTWYARTAEYKNYWYMTCSQHGDTRRAATRSSCALGNDRTNHYFTTVVQYDPGPNICSSIEG